MSKFDVIFSNSSFNLLRFDLSLLITISGALSRKFSLDNFEFIPFNNRSISTFVNVADQKLMRDEECDIARNGAFSQPICINN